MKKKSPTIKDVADIAQVSVSTVSRVINNKPNVKQHVRDIVEKIITDLEYKPPTGQSWKKEQNRRFGLMIPDITNPFFSLLIKGMSNVARIENIEIILCDVDKNPEIEKLSIERLIENGVEGLLHIPFAEPESSTIEDLVKEGFPVVFVDREPQIPRSFSILSDNEEGAYQAVTYLLNLGHRNIVFIAGPPHFSTTRTRQKGYELGFTEMGLTNNKDLLIHGDTTFISAYNATLELLGQRKNFTAIFASNDLMALGAWKALEERGWKVPEDVSVIGYDDIPISSIMSLTTIAQPAYEIGRNAIILLIDAIEGKRTPPERILLRDSLIIRKSCKMI